MAGNPCNFGFIYAYLAVSVSAALMLHRRRELTPKKLVMVAASVSVLIAHW